MRKETSSSALVGEQPWHRAPEDFPPLESLTLISQQSFIKHLLCASFPGGNKSNEDRLDLLTTQPLFLPAKTLSGLEHLPQPLTQQSGAKHLVGANIYICM